VEVDPARLPRWLDGFRERHGDGDAVVDAGALVVTGADGVVARLHPPPGAPLGADLAEFIVNASQPRRLGLLLARKGAAAFGVAWGEELERHKVESWYVQSRTAAGGQSQQRFARRRANQAAAAAGKAADLAVRVLLPVVDELDVVVTGGDKPTVDRILSDPRLAPLRARRGSRHLPVGTPNFADLRAAVTAARAVEVHLSV